MVSFFQNLSSGMKAVFVIIMLLAVIAVFWAAYALVSYATDKSTGVTDIAMSAEFKKYDNGKPLLGSEVDTALVMFKNRPQFSILVKTGLQPAGFYLESSTTTGTCFAPGTGTDKMVSTTMATCATQVKSHQIADQTSTYYVNTSASFKSKVYYDRAGEARLLELEQIAR